MNILPSHTWSATTAPVSYFSPCVSVFSTRRDKLFSLLDKLIFKKSLERVHIYLCFHVDSYPIELHLGFNRQAGLCRPDPLTDDCGSFLCGTSGRHRSTCLHRTSTPFSDGSMISPERGAPTYYLTNFSRISPKNLHENEDILGERQGRASLAPPLYRSATAFDLFNRHCDGQNGLHTHFVRQRNVCYGDGNGIARCEQTLRPMVEFSPRGGSRTSPRRGRQSLGGRLPNILIIFSEKPYEIKEILVHRGMRAGGAP